MRNLSATAYLSMLSISDLLVLVTFGALKWVDVTLYEWMGSYRIQLLGYNGVCQAYEYVVQVARFVSAWCIVIFTVGK